MHGQVKVVSGIFPTSNCNANILSLLVDFLQFVDCSGLRAEFDDRDATVLVIKTVKHADATRLLVREVGTVAD